MIHAFKVLHWGWLPGAAGKIWGKEDIHLAIQRYHPDIWLCARNFISFRQSHHKHAPEVGDKATSLTLCTPLSFCMLKRQSCLKSTNG